jgi:hypothetical protein
MGVRKDDVKSSLQARYEYYEVRIMNFLTAVSRASTSRVQ